MKYASILIVIAIALAGCNSRDRGPAGGDPTDPPVTGDDAGTDPVDPMDPMDPMDPTDPVDPVDPTDPTVRDLIPPDIAAICDRVGPGYIEACDVDREFVVIPPETPRPTYMDLFPGVADPFNMNGWEWWQKWPGGLNPTFESEEASDAGMRCSVASALRYAAIMQEPPEDVRRMLSETTWEGRFFNWNDDFSHRQAEGAADGAVLWAWEWYLVKWISQTDADGNCYLPTQTMLERAAENCLGVAALNDGVLQGCQD